MYLHDCTHTALHHFLPGLFYKDANIYKIKECMLISRESLVPLVTTVLPVILGHREELVSRDARGCLEMRYAYELLCSDLNCTARVN